MADEDEIDLTEIGNDLKETDDTLIAGGDGVKDEGAHKDTADKGQGEDKPKRVSIRDSIKQAITETNERQQQELKLKEPKEGSKELADKQVSSEPKETHETKKEETTLTNSDIKPPVSWAKEAKDSWNTLPPAIQNAVLKREKEFSDGIKQYADDAKKFRELEPFLAPHRQSMVTQGVNEVQVIGRLFDWFNHLSVDNPDHKALAFQALARSFGVDLSRIHPQQSKAADKEGETDKNKLDQQNIDISQHPAFQQIYRTVEQMQAQQIETQKQSALNYVNEWSKDKTHFPKVRDTMRALLSSGAIPLKNGMLDLDAAYEKAIRMDDELYKQYQDELVAKAADEKAKELAKKERDKVQQLQNKRNAASSLRPNAPSSSMNGRKPNQKMSVRDSIRAAIAEHSGS